MLQVLQVVIINLINNQLESVVYELPTTTTKSKDFGPRYDQLVTSRLLAQLRYYITK
jgi:hypothetical protein